MHWERIENHLLPRFWHPTCEVAEEKQWSHKEKPGGLRLAIAHALLERHTCTTEHETMIFDVQNNVILKIVIQAQPCSSLLSLAHSEASKAIPSFSVNNIGEFSSDASTKFQ